MRKIVVYIVVIALILSILIPSGIALFSIGENSSSSIDTSTGVNSPMK